MSYIIQAIIIVFLTLVTRCGFMYLHPKPVMHHLNKSV